MILIPFSKSSNLLIKVPSLFPGRDEVAVRPRGGYGYPDSREQLLGRISASGNCQGQREKQVSLLRRKNEDRKDSGRAAFYYLLVYEVEKGVKYVDRKIGRI
jgi:hypothetical protein